MSNATELLRRTLEALEAMRMVELMQAAVEELPEEIRAYLEAEKEAEPVAWQSLTDEELREIEKEFHAERVRTSDEEYLIIYPADYWDWQRAIEKAVQEKNHPSRPLPSRKPMTEEEIKEICPFSREPMKIGFNSGVRFAEKHHGIGGSDE